MITNEKEQKLENARFVKVGDVIKCQIYDEITGEKVSEIKKDVTQDLTISHIKIVEFKGEFGYNQGFAGFFGNKE